mgnify:CR=1 FL=1
MFIRLFAFILVTVSFGAFAKTPVVLISIDGFAHKYLQQYKPANILELSTSGVTANGMISVFPSKTFPNHLSIVTGMRPVQHGIVHNKFYNRKLDKKYTLGAGRQNPDWVTSAPIWESVEEAGGIAATYFWPESELKHHKHEPTHKFAYDGSVTNKARVDQVIQWLALPENKQPDFITTYFSTIDTVGHNYGTHSKELKHAIAELDDLIGYLNDTIAKRFNGNVNLILVSDHGMVDLKETAAILPSDILPNHENVLVINGQTQLYVYTNSQEAHIETRSQLQKSGKIEGIQRYKVYEKGSYPEHWHFNEDSPVIPDIIANAIPPYTFVKKQDYVGAATHGFDPKNNDDLKAIFIANGPGFKKGANIQPFENIHVYALLRKLLHLSPRTEIESNIEPFVDVLK